MKKRIAKTVTHFGRSDIAPIVITVINEEAS